MRFAVSLAVTAALAGTVTAPAAARSYVIQGDAKIGGYAVKANRTLDGAIKEFGTPLLRRDPRYREFCAARWPRHGLRIVFYNLGGEDPCRPQWGYFSYAEITGRQWRTSKGLRIGEPLRRIWVLYPGAKPHPPYWWLVVRTSRYGPGATAFGALTAKVRDGRVVAFIVRYPAGGD